MKNVRLSDEHLRLCVSALRREAADYRIAAEKVPLDTDLCMTLIEAADRRLTLANDLCDAMMRVEKR